MMTIAAIFMLVLAVAVRDFTTAENQPRVCVMSKEVGPCSDKLPRFFYNTGTKKCEQFTYGGCHGNGNNFLTLSYCKESCEPVCNLPKEVGTCKSAEQRFFFNDKTGSCESFTYGGCLRNGNNFIHLSDCRNRCEPEVHWVCTLAPDAGSCEKESIQLYFFSPQLRQCLSFTYGGCGGNGNRFRTKRDCLRICDNQK